MAASDRDIDQARPPRARAADCSALIRSPITFGTALANIHGRSSGVRGGSVRIAITTTAIVAVVALGLLAQDRAADQAARTGAALRLAPTAHPPLPALPSHYWLIPEVSASATSANTGNDAAARFARGARLIAAGDFAAGLPLVNAKALDGSPLAPYADYYAGVALAGLGRMAEADAVLTALAARAPEGYLEEAGTLQLADVLIKSGEADRAEDILEALSREKTSAPEQVWLALARAEEAIPHRDHALDAYRRLYYEFATSVEA